MLKLRKQEGMSIKYQFADIQWIRERWSLTLCGYNDSVICKMIYLRLLPSSKMKHVNPRTEYGCVLIAERGSGLQDLHGPIQLSARANGGLFFNQGKTDTTRDLLQTIVSCGFSNM